MLWYKYIKPFRKQAIIGFIFKMTEAFFELMVPLVVAQIIDYGIGQNDKQYIWKMGILLFALTFIGYGCALVCQYFASYTSQSFGTLMRNDMYKVINRYDYEDIDRIGTPSLITRLTNDVVQLQLAVAMAIRLVSRSPFLIIGSLIMAFRINMQMAIIFVITAPLLALCIYFVVAKSMPMYLKIQKQLDKVSLVCRENLTGIRVIRAFSRQKEEKRRFQNMTETQKDMQIKVGKLSALLNPMTNMIVNIAIIVILYVGGIRINGGTLTQGEVVALINYMNQILLSMFVFANVIIIFNKASASYKRIEEVLDISPRIIKEDNKDYQDVFLSFDTVSFAYQGNVALQNVSFEVNKNETIGIIGGTGSGKSTLVNLIPRFYDSEGQIYIKGQTIQSYDLKELRNMIGIVPQKAVLFKGTLRDNMQWGKQNASDEEIWQALDLAQASAFVKKLENGLDTMVTQDGKNLSGGQRQRLTIARALVKKPEILILDDSASALDFATDAALRKSLKTIQSTIFIVSQRVSSIMHADKIIVLSHGEIVGVGTHQYLLEHCDIYQEIAHSQLAKEETV
ncbi:MAG: ABC transporter ATP-binding protein [Coprobacillus sp.]|nr:ABC transporter ATP-binding protein [Coprobacillus sp.]MCI9092547.1 ABC transporter ATP-binding protein [Coprobacillus sp.]